MPIDNKIIQDKVLKIAANKAIPNNTKLAVRKQFYVLKGYEVDLETTQENFNESLSEFNKQLDAIINGASKTKTIDVVDSTTVNSVPVEETEEEISIVKPATNSGLKVRMQEEVDSAEDDTDFEVPFEADEQ